MPSVDLNSDLGEGYGSWSPGDDDALLQVVTSANVAYNDLAGFGRRFIVAAVLHYDRDLPVMGLPGSAWLRLAEEAGVTVVLEAFADRAYNPDGTLVPRREPGAVLHDPEEITRRCVAMAHGEPVTDVEGDPLTLRPESICVHGDTEGAVEIARSVRAGLERAGVSIEPFAVP